MLHQFVAVFHGSPPSHPLCVRLRPRVSFCCFRLCGSSSGAVFVPWHLQKALDPGRSRTVRSEVVVSRETDCNGAESEGSGIRSLGEPEGKGDVLESSRSRQPTYPHWRSQAGAEKDVKKKESTASKKPVGQRNSSRRARDETEDGAQREGEEAAERRESGNTTRQKTLVAAESLSTPGPCGGGVEQERHFDLNITSGRGLGDRQCQGLLEKGPEDSAAEEVETCTRPPQKEDSGSTSSNPQTAARTESQDDGPGGITTLFRYYHVFSKEEILGLCGRVGGLEVVECYFDANNWGVVLRKT